MVSEVVVESEVPAIVQAAVERRIPAIVSVAAGHEGPASAPVAAEEVAVVVCKVRFFYIEVVEPKVLLRSVGLPVEEGVSIRY